MRKKLILSIITALYCLLGMAALADESLSDENVSVKIITGMGIMSYDENGDFRGKDVMSREEFTAAALRVMRADGSAASGNKKIYNDVDTDRWSYPYILTATEMGLISGDEYGNFRPEEAIDINEANKILVMTLGLHMEGIADIMGGYPAGYNKIASALKITRNNFNSSKLTRYDIAEMMYSVLDAPIPEYSSTGDIIFDTDRTLLADTWKLEKAKGTVIANSATSLYKQYGGVMENGVEISDGKNSQIFHSGDSGADKLLGYSIEYCYSKEDDTVAAAAPLKIHKVLTVNADEIQDDTKKSEIVYSPNNTSKIKSERIPGDIPVLYNGVFTNFADLCDENIFNIQNGKITILYRQSEMVLVDIEEYRDYLVTGKTRNDGMDKLFFHENNYKVTDMQIDTDRTSYTINYGDETLSVDDIAIGDVLSVVSDDMSLKNPKFVHIELSRMTKEGSVTAISDDSVTIDGVQYELSGGRERDFKLNDTGLFYFNFNNEPVYFEKGLSKIRAYGYLLSAGLLEEGENDGNYCYFKILTSDGKVQMFYGGPKVKINSKSVTYEGIDSAIAPRQLVRYKQSAEGKITEITTAAEKGNGEYIGYSEDEFSMDSRSGVAYTYKSTPPVSLSTTDSLTGVYSAFLITEDTIVFDVSSNDIDDYYVGKATGFFADGLTYTVDIYDNDSNMQAAVVVYRGDISVTDKVGWNNAAFVVDKIFESVDDEGDTQYEIAGFENGKQKTLYKDEESIYDEGGTNIDLNDLQRGSVIQYTNDLKGKVNYYRLLYAPMTENMPQKAWKGSDINSQLTTFYGNVYTKTDNSLTFTYDAGKTICAYSASNTNVYIYNSSGRGNIEAASLNDVGVYKDLEGNSDLVFMRMYRGNIADILIIR